MRRLRATRHIHKMWAETIDGATHHNAEWTGPELEILVRGGATARELAMTLGRTTGAVRAALHRIKTEPKVARLAGLDAPH